MFGMGQYEKVGDSAKVLLRRGVCVLRVFFIYFVVVFLRRALFCKKSGHPILSLSFIHSFGFIRVRFARSRVVLLLCCCLKLPTTTTTHHRVLIILTTYYYYYYY